MLLNSTHSCSRQGVVAARLTSERPGGVIPLSKNIFCTGSTFIAAVTVDVCEKDRKRLAVRARCFACYLLESSRPCQELAGSSVTPTPDVAITAKQHYIT